MKFLFLLTTLLVSFVATTSASRFACWRDVVLLDGVGKRNSDGTYPLPRSCYGQQIATVTDTTDATDAADANPGPATSIGEPPSVGVPQPTLLVVKSPLVFPGDESPSRSDGGWSQDLVLTNCFWGDRLCHSLLTDLSAGFVEDPMAITGYTSFIVDFNPKAMVDATLLPPGVHPEGTAGEYGICRTRSALPRTTADGSSRNASGETPRPPPPVKSEEPSWTEKVRGRINEKVLRFWRDGHAWWATATTMDWVHLAFFTGTIMWSLGCVYAACCPRRHGGKRLRTTEEDLTFAQRLLVTSTLWLACGGATIAFFSVGIYATFRAWCCRGTSSGHAAVVVMLALWGFYKIPLPVYKRGAPVERLSNPLFRLWRKFFGFTCVYDRGSSSTSSSSPSSSKKIRGRENRRKRLTRDQRREQTTMVAQMPHGIMPFGSLLGIGILTNALEGLFPIGGVVADTLLKAPVLRRAVSWLGVRRAGREEIEQMFEDGFKAVGVVSGGVAEMFVSATTERIVSARPNFAKIALKGGHEVRLVFVFGVSRTHKMLWGSYALTKKVGLPIIVGHGAFGTIPYRETMKMVVSAPIKVEKRKNPSENHIAALRKRMEAELCRLYYVHRPDWETRPLSLVRGETSDAELDAIAARAIAASSR